MKYELDRVDFITSKQDIYFLPTIKMYFNDRMYLCRNFSIEFHFLIFHGRLLFVKNEYKY